MNRKFFVCLISVTIISSMMSSGYAQSTLNVRAFINGYLFPNGQTLAIIDPVNAPTLFDTLTVELHSTVNGSILFSQKVLFDIDGYGSLLIPINFFGNSYYLVLNHRNSIETWSSVPILINGTINFDFTSSITQAMEIIWIFITIKPVFTGMASLIL